MAIDRKILFPDITCFRFRMSTIVGKPRDSTLDGIAVECRFIDKYEEGPMLGRHRSGERTSSRNYRLLCRVSFGGRNGRVLARLRVVWTLGLADRPLKPFYQS